MMTCTAHSRYRFRALVLTGAAMVVTAVLGGCGFSESGGQTHQAAMTKQNAGFERISLYDAVAISLQRNIDAPVVQQQDMPRDDASLRHAWEKIDDSLVGLNPAQAARNQNAEHIIATTRSVYLRAVAAAYLQDRVEQGLARLREALDNAPIDAAELADREDQIREIQLAYAPFATARQELAALLGIDNPNVLMLDDLPLAAPGPGGEDSLEALERSALTNRPELEILGVPSQDEIESLRQKAAMTLPESRLPEFSAQFGDGLTRILNMKLALEDPQTRTRFEQLRTQAVTTAIVAQVRLAHAQVQQSEEDALRAVRENATGTLVSTLRAELARHHAMIAMQDAQNLLKRSVGVAPVPVEAGRMQLAALSAALQQRDGAVVAPNLVAMAEQVYQQSPLVPVAFHPVDFAAKIPLAQKIGTQEGVETSIFHRFGANPRTLKISAGRVKTLLEAPIIEP